MAIAQVSVAPVGTGTTSLSEYVALALKVLDAQTSVKYRLTPMGTVLEGDLDLVNCLGNPDICQRKDKCVARSIWEEMNLKVRKYLCSITLADMMEHEKSLDSFLHPGP